MNLCEHYISPGEHNTDSEGEGKQMITVQMSTDQIRAFAISIRDDIAPYVAAHEMEYKEYLDNMEGHEKETTEDWKDEFRT